MKGFRLLLVLCIGCSGVTNSTSSEDDEAIPLEFENILGSWDWVDTFFEEVDSTSSPETTGLTINLLVDDSTQAGWFKSGVLERSYSLSFTQNRNAIRMEPIPKDSTDTLLISKRISGFNRDTGYLIIHDICEGCGVYRFKVDE